MSAISSSISAPGSTVPHTRAEIAWLNYLVDRGLPVARPVTSQRGLWLEVLDPGRDQGRFVAVAFERAPGVILDDEPVILGSFNFTDSANESNDENLLIVHDLDVAARYRAEFERVYAQAAQASSD